MFKLACSSITKELVKKMNELEDEGYKFVNMEVAPSGRDTNLYPSVCILMHRPN